MRLSLDLVGPVRIDEVYVTAEKKGRERDVSTSRNLWVLAESGSDVRHTETTISS